MNFVKSWENLIEMHMLATTYHCRPSDIMGICDEWGAYQFDIAVLMAGVEETNRQYKEAQDNAHRRGKGGDAKPMPPDVLQSLMNK